MRALFDIRRRRSDQEISVDAVPETHRGHAVTGHANESDLRVTLLDALAELPERDRAIVVLRYWEDNSVETVADVLRVSVSVVKTQSARSLARLRNRLGDSRAELLVD
jgi:RNA polymerase sigma factor (sigma-70 family)